MRTPSVEFCDNTKMVTAVPTNGDLLSICLAALKSVVWSSSPVSGMPRLEVENGDERRDPS